MTDRRLSSLVRFPLVSLVAMTGLSACGLLSAHAPGPSEFTGMEQAATPLVSGTVTYRERMMAPPGSKLSVVLQDTSRADAGAVLLAEWSAALDEGGVPKAFALKPEAPLDARLTYTVRATIRGPEGDLLWTTDTANRVPVDGASAIDMGELVMVKVTPAPEAEPASPVSGSWIVESVGGMTTTGGKPPTMAFSDAGRVSGNGGCNGYSGSYTQRGATLDFSGVMMTLMACMNDSANAREAALGAVLRGPATYSINGEGQLVLTGANGVEIVAKRAPVTHELARTTWMVTAMGGVAVVSGREPQINFMPDGSVNGSTGCNTFFGKYVQDGAAVTFDGIGMTKMACSPPALMQQEAAFVGILQGETTVSQENAETSVLGKLTVMGGKGVSFTAVPVLPKTATPDRKVIEGAEWRVEDINRMGIIDNSHLTLKFGADGTLSGSTNCNTFSGSFKSSRTKLTFASIAVTEKACLAPALQAQEQTYLEALGDGMNWAITGDGALELSGDGGRRLLLRR